ncbi:MAG: hypothetical protein MAG431_00205 [Chloroflexi bacterium]|nr:hypothetical protein [Chloroflexota bacterium]
MSNMVEVVIDSIRVSLMSHQRVIILKEVGFERYLPIMVGVYEAEHLTLALQEVEISRPLTYELFANVLDDLDAELMHVEVVDLRNETFFGNLVFNVGGTMLTVDSRPSDAINLAVRMDIPILVDRDVLDEAGLIPEEDLTTPGHDPDAADGEPIEEERLSVFEDYLDQLGPDQINSEDEEEDD